MPDLADLAVWRQVIRRALRDLCEDDDNLRNEAIRWIGDGNERDFLTVCSHADIESTSVVKLAKRLLVLGTVRAKVYLTQIMEVTKDDDDNQSNID